MSGYEIPQINNTISRITDAIHSQKKEEISEKFAILQRNEPNRIQALFLQDLAEIKNELLSIMQGYISDRKSYFLQNFFQTNVGQLFFSKIAKTPEPVTKTNEAYIHTFTSTDKDYYSLDLYKKVIEIIEGIIDLSSAKKAITTTDLLLSEEAMENTPTLCGYLRKISRKLNMIIKNDKYQEINYLNKIEQVFENEIHFIRESIVNFANNRMEKIVNSVFEKNPSLKIYNDFLNDLTDSKNKLNDIEHNLLLYKEWMAGQNYYDNALYNAELGMNPWEPAVKISKSEVLRLASEYEHSAYAKLSDMQNQKIMAYSNYLQKKEIALKYATTNFSESSCLIDLARNDRPSTQKIMVFIPEEYIDYLCSQISKTYLQEEQKDINTFKV